MAITSTTSVTGIFGHPLSHSLSPIMHNRAFEALGLNYVYLPFDVHPNNLRESIAALQALGIKGINVTIPHKQEVISLLDEVSQEAAIIGAVNTIVVKESKLHGFNTDGRGFLASLQEAGFDPSNKKVLLLGVGGACRAVSMSLCWAGVKKLTLVARNLAKAEQLAADLGVQSDVDIELSSFTNLHGKKVAEADLIINTTPIGMYPHEDSMPELKYEHLHSAQFVSDLIYNPLETRFLKAAKKRGCCIVNGVGTLVYQGALAFELFTGKTAPLDIMRQAVLDSVGISRKIIP